MKSYNFVYKTTHTGGLYYIGRHSTDNIDDGYFGSGIWVNRCSKDKLKREILEFAQSVEDLCILEENYIKQHFDDPKCMNMKLASVGWTSDDAKKIVNDQIKNGKNALANGKKIKRNIVSQDARLKAVEKVKSMFKDGTHPLGGELAKQRIQQQIDSGTHAGTIVFSKIHECPNCGKQGKGAIMYRHHYKNCKNVKK